MSDFKRATPNSTAIEEKNMSAQERAAARAAELRSHGLESDASVDKFHVDASIIPFGISPTWGQHWTPHELFAHRGETVRALHPLGLPVGRFPVRQLPGFGNTANGISGMTVDQDTLGTTVTLPFRIVGLVEDPPGVNGTDITTEYNQVIVAFNNASTRTNGAGPTGIA